MTTSGSTTNPFELWQEMLRKSSEAWSQTAAGFAGPPPFGAYPFGSFPFGAGAGVGANPFAPPFAAADMQQTWQAFFNAWSEQTGKAMSDAPGPQTMQDAQRQWTQQLEAMAATFAETMSTEDFSRMLGKYLEQTLVWQERMAQQANPQIDAALRAYNLPSRSQIDRLFGRIIGIEERLEDLEDELRKVRTELASARRTPATRARTPRSASPETAGENDPA